MYTCGSYRGGEVHHSWPKGVENSLAFTCIKSECPCHLQRRGGVEGGEGGLRVSNDCCINLWMRNKQTFCSSHVHFILTGKSLINNYFLFC